MKDFEPRILIYVAVALLVFVAAVLIFFEVIILK